MQKIYCVDCRPSRLLKILSGLFFLLLSIAVFVVLESLSYLYLPWIFIILLIFQYKRFQVELTSFYGLLVLSSKTCYWQNQRCIIVKKPILFQHIIVIDLLFYRTRQKKTLLLAHDSMTSYQWRTLCYCLNQRSK